MSINHKTSAGFFILVIISILAFEGAAKGISRTSPGTDSSTPIELTESQISNPLEIPTSLINRASPASLLKAIEHLQKTSDISKRPELLNRYAQLKYGLSPTFKLAFDPGATGLTFNTKTGTVTTKEGSTLDLATLSSNPDIVGVRFLGSKGPTPLPPGTNGILFMFKDERKVTVTTAGQIKADQGALLVDSFRIQPTSKELTINSKDGEISLTGKGTIKAGWPIVAFENSIKIFTYPDGKLSMIELSNTPGGQPPKATIGGKTITSTLEKLTVSTDRFTYDLISFGNKALLTDNGIEFSPGEPSPKGTITLDEPGHPPIRIINGRNVQIEAKGLAKQKSTEPANRVIISSKTTSETYIDSMFDDGRPLILAQRSDRQYPKQWSSFVDAIREHIDMERPLQFESTSMRRSLTDEEKNKVKQFVRSVAGTPVTTLGSWVGARAPFSTGGGTTSPFHEGVDILGGRINAPPGGILEPAFKGRPGILVYNLPDGDRLEYHHAKLIQEKGKSYIAYTPTGKTSGPHIHLEWRRGGTGADRGTLMDPATWRPFAQQPVVYALRRPMRSRK